MSDCTPRIRMGVSARGARPCARDGRCSAGVGVLALEGEIEVLEDDS